MEIKQGIPDGYEFNRQAKYQDEHARRQEKQQQSLEALQQSVPSRLIRGEPVQYGRDGLPLIEENTLEQQVQSTVERPVNTDPFFATPSARQGIQGRQQNPMNQLLGVQGKQQNPTNQPQIQPQLSKGSLQYHPVLKKMLNVFGLKKNSRHDLDIFNENTNDKLTYTLTLVSEELQSWAMMEGKNKMVTEAEVGAIYFELLFGCCAVIALDHVPLWQIFNIEILNEEKPVLDADPLDMSTRLRKVCARQLAVLLWSETVPVGDKLVEFYQDKVLGKKIQSSMDKEFLEKVRYVCPLDDCDHYEFFKPIIEDGIEKRYFCKFHGIELVKTVDILKELNVPLA